MGYSYNGSDYMQSIYPELGEELVTGTTQWQTDAWTACGQGCRRNFQILHVSGFCTDLAKHCQIVHFHLFLS